MTVTPDQARARLAEARRKMRIATVLAGNGREGFDHQAGLTLAVLEVIQLLEDALA